MFEIKHRDDIELLINSFYDKVRNDQLLSPLFAHVDWPKHLPVMYNFWASMIFGEQSYQGNPFQKHMPLKLSASHFDRWLELFFTTVDENFNGEAAQEIKMRAQSIARVWQHKLNLAV